MRVFLTGASGFIGSAIVQELIQAGHQVVGLVRSDASAKSLTEAGGEPFIGSLDDLDGLARGASAADAVIHTAFVHDFSNYAASAQTDKRAIETFGTALAGSNRPLIVTAGILVLQSSHGDLITEDDLATPEPRASETATMAFTDSGVRTSVIRLPPSVHDKGDHGFVPALIDIARQKGVSAYVGNGNNRWPAVHRLDAAKLYRLALEKGTAGSRYNVIADQGIPFREIAETIGRHLNLPVVSKSPEEAPDHFAWLARFVAFDSPASSAKTREQLAWQPTQPGLIEDLNMGHYFER
ncbi:SDR family oxidoreductase [Spirosoma oryzicola]|uniref:SDR family oxidoreductase n=1 Tax=Spirosoma oryzicola TaxID=2898794 RepID=UPI001E651AC9|nr:SDR family oxidoreductase [Spirosoma oryzicola]UHG93826.1 SDR family oxidoreductase [Spirosoma oryzicola]